MWCHDREDQNASGSKASRVDASSPMGKSPIQRLLAKAFWQGVIHAAAAFAHTELALGYNKSSRESSSRPSICAECLGNGMRFLRWVTYYSSSDCDGILSALESGVGGHGSDSPCAEEACFQQ